MAISIKEVALLSEVFLALVTTAVSQDRAVVEQLKALGGIVLSIDGVQPEKGNDTLYLLREIQSGRVLVARNLRASNASEIEKLIEGVKALGVPILGVVSDKQESLCLAIERALPGVPHQLCQSHYLRDMAQPVSDADRQLKKNLRIKVRGIKAIEDSIERQPPSPESRIAGRYCEAIRTVLRDDGKYPLDPAGLKLYAKLSRIEESIQRAIEVRESRLLRRVLRLLSVLSVYIEEFERICRVYEWIHRIAQLLEAEAGKETTSRSARRKLMRYSARLDAKGDESVQGYINHIQKQSRAFESRLFTYVEQPLLPRTNNDLEQFIGRMKKARRQATGRKNTQEYILREGQYVAILYGLPEVSSYIARFAEVDFAAFRETLERMRRRQERSNAWRVRRDLPGYLKDLEQTWTSSE